MEFVLRIFFSGLIAFVPSTDGKEVTVLLVNTPHEYALADGSTLAHHRPMLLARAANCTGTCRTDDHEAIAQFMFANKTPEQALTSFNNALAGGGAWQLSSSELKLIGPQEPLAIRTGVRGRTEDGALLPVPRTAQEREDFSWVADLREVAPGTEGFKSAYTGTEAPPGCVIAARLKLRSGKVLTYSVAKIDGKAKPVHFRKPSGEGPEAPYAQALATWVEAEIHVPGGVLEITDTSFNDPMKVRKMTLTPQEGVIELALLNLPPFVAPPPDAEAPSPGPGQHFQIFYDLVKTPPARAERLVPHQALSPSPSEPQVNWIVLHPRATMWSNLLEGLGLAPRGKTPYELTLCPIVQD